MPAIESSSALNKGEQFQPLRYSCPESFMSGPRLNRLHSKGFATVLVAFVYLLSLCVDSCNLLALVNATTITDINGVRICAIQQFNPNVDYFEHKVTPNFTARWNVTYHKSYKRVTVSLTKALPSPKNSTVVFYLYNAGAPKPSLEFISSTHGDVARDYASLQVVEIPIRSVGVTSSTHIPYLEYIRHRANLKVIAVDGETVNPCVKKLVEQKRMNDDVTYPFNQDDVRKAINDQGQIDAFFFSPFSVNSFKNNLEMIKNVSSTTAVIPVMEIFELETLAVVEWVEYFALFYNKEQAANSVASNIKLRMNCSTELVNTKRTGPKPKVLITSFAYGSYDDLICPHWQCELISKAGGEVIQFPFTAYPWPNHTLFLEFAKDADVWIYTDANWNETSYYFASPYSTAFPDVVNQIKAVQNKQVYDIQKQSYLSWFEARPAEPDVLLRDFIKVLHPTQDLIGEHTNVFLRNVFTEKAANAISDTKKCTNVFANKFNNWQEDGCALTENTDIIIIPGLDGAEVFCPTPAPTTPTAPTTSSPTPRATSICSPVCSAIKKKSQCIRQRVCRCKWSQLLRTCFSP